MRIVNPSRVAMARVALLVTAGSFSTVSQAYNFSFNDWTGQEISGVSNTVMTMGAGWRIEDRDPALVGKSNNNPDVCGRKPDGTMMWQSCQGLFRTQTFVAEHLVKAKGLPTTNADDGNLNYDKGDLTQAPFKLTQDINLTRGDFGFFARGLYFYDTVNNNFREFHPNRVTRQNMSQVGEISTTGDELAPLPGLPIPVGLNPLFQARYDSTACPANRNPTGEACGIVYGKGGVVTNKRKGKELLRQIGTDAQLLDLNFYGQLPLPLTENSLSFKVGRQTISWGESTVLVFDSLNQVNPINANNFFRVGMALEEIFTPINMLSLSTNITDALTVNGFYQLEWKPLEVPAPGSFFSPIDIGTNNVGKTLNLGFGSVAEDPDRVARLLDNPLSGLTNTSGALQRLPDREPDSKGQFGIQMRYYAEQLNNGTDLGLYFANYHSRIPYISVFSVPTGCGKAAIDTATFAAACSDTPAFHALTDPNNPLGATDDAVHFDYIKVRLEYPKDIKMFGASFNTTVADWALQGELAYRPDAPLQVDAEDLALAGFAPAGVDCGQGVDCLGSPVGYGILPDGTFGFYPNSRFVVDEQGTPGGFDDTLNLVVGHAPGSGRNFPNFIIPWRGGVVGKNPPNQRIRGWEYFDTYQLNFGATYIMGATDMVSRFIRADQIIALFETGATIVPDLPALNRLQLEAPGTYYSATAGADGSGAHWKNAKQKRQACSTVQNCSYGGDGLRFNPHQQDLDLYPDKLSYGVDMVALIRYESVFPGISLQPILVLKQDIDGTSPGLVSNFVKGRFLADTSLEVRYKSNLSFNFGYQMYAGGGAANVLRDRDNARFFVKYAF